MDRKRPPRSFDKGTMCPCRIMQGQPLLSSHTRRPLQSCAYEAHRRNLHREALPWLQDNNPEIAERGAPRQSQTDSRAYANVGIGRDTTRTKHIKAPSGTSQIPVPSKRSRHFRTPPCVEYRYYVYSTSWRFCILSGCDRLVQSTSAILPALKQFRGHLLPRCFRGGDPNLRTATNLQYRSRSAVHVSRVRKCGSWKEHSFQHGWQRTGSRQYFCGTSMEICKI